MVHPNVILDASSNIAKIKQDMELTGKEMYRISKKDSLIMENNTLRTVP